jgi:hypothetical protein
LIWNFGKVWIVVCNNVIDAQLTTHVYGTNWKNALLEAQGPMNTSDRWHAAMNSKPSHSLGRIDVKGGFSLNPCTKQVYEIAEKSPQEHFEGNMAVHAVMT